MFRSQAKERGPVLPPAAPDPLPELIGDLAGTLTESPAEDAIPDSMANLDDESGEAIPDPVAGLDDDPATEHGPADEPVLVPFPHQELAEPFSTRGPVAHVKAIRALARATGRHPRLRRRDLPDDDSFESLVAGGLIDERGHLTSNGLAVAQAMTNAPMRIRVQASVDRTPLVFEAHLFEGRALILATPPPAQYVAHLGLAAADDVPRSSPHVGLDMDSLSRLPIAIASWAGLQDSDAEPDDHAYSATWEQVEAKFANDLAPDGLDAVIWAQPWIGLAISTEPATSTLTVIQAGGHYYQLSRPDTDTARMSWLSPVAVWNEIIVILQGAIPAQPESSAS